MGDPDKIAVSKCLVFEPPGASGDGPVKSPSTAAADGQDSRSTSQSPLMFRPSPTSEAGTREPTAPISLPSLSQLATQLNPASINDLISILTGQIQIGPLSESGFTQQDGAITSAPAGTIVKTHSMPVAENSTLPIQSFAMKQEPELKFSSSVMENLNSPLNIQSVSSPINPKSSASSISLEQTSDDFPMSPSPGFSTEDGCKSGDGYSIAEGQHIGGGKMKRRTLNRDEKLICLVCGDKALGCNFDAISCESCKAFFRRNALKAKKQKCLFEGSCKIDVNTRRFCPSCRLTKCFTVGMKKEFILGDEERRKRSNSKAVPVMISSPSSCVVSSNSMSTTTATVVKSTTIAPSTSPSSIAPGINLPLAHPSQPAVAAPAMMTSSQQSSPSMMSLPITNNITSIPVSRASQLGSTQIILQIPAGSTESVNLLSLSRFVKTNEGFNTPMDSILVRRLTVEENHMLQELMQIYDLSFTVDLEPLIHVKKVDPSFTQLVNQSSITVLRIIKFAKRLEEFVRLPQECQIGILKGCWINILMLRSVSLYDMERDMWVTPRGDIPTEILKNATGFVKLHDDHVRYCKSIKSITHNDLVIIVLMIVVVLFAPEGPHVITRELVSNIQDKYLILLKHYLESKYTYGKAAEMFPFLVSKMKELKEIAEDHGRYLLDVNPNEIEPIMLEILDLK